MTVIVLIVSVILYLKGMKDWTSDVAFGHQKLAGCNPILIELCDRIPEQWVIYLSLPMYI